MTAITNSLLLTLVEVEHHLQIAHTSLAEMSEQDLETRTHITRWTVPRKRYEKHIGDSSALFESMGWDEIMAFVQMHEEEHVPDPWRFLCMLEHLSDRFQAKMDVFRDIIHHMRIAVAKARGVLEIGISDSEATSYQKSLEETTCSLMALIREAQAATMQQRNKAIEVSQQLEDVRRPPRRTEKRKASTPVLPWS